MITTDKKIHNDPFASLCGPAAPTKEPKRVEPAKPAPSKPDTSPPLKPSKTPRPTTPKRDPGDPNPDTCEL